MVNKKTSVFVYLLLSLSACAPTANWKGRTRGSAPSTNKDTGVVLQGAKREEVSAILDRYPKAKVRTLNEAHGMYEVFNVGLDEVRTEFQGTAENNHFFSTSQPQRSGYVRPGFSFGTLNPCRDGNLAPTAKLKVSLEDVDVKFATIKLGAKVHIDASASSLADGDQGPLKINLMIQTAQGSSTSEITRTTAQSDFEPDAMGLYSVSVIVQGQSDVCSAATVRFAVTDQQPFVKPTPSDQVPFIGLQYFKHLKLVSAEESWKYSQGEGMIIAVIDSGVNYNHPSIAENILVNDKEIPADGIDNEKNGYIDDYVGLDLANHSPWPFDDSGHGSNVACLAASHDFGIARRAKILPVKAMSPFGGDVGSIAAGVRFAVDRGANVINMSLGGSGYPPQILLDAFAYAASKNVLIVSATGNGDPRTDRGYDIDQTPFYPASLHLPNILTVAAFDSANAISTYSNFGKTSAAVVAPGGSRRDPMFSCNYDNPKGMLYVGMDGTSMAAPVAAGIAASAWSMAPRMTYTQLTERLLKAGPEIEELKPITVSGRHLNALSAVTEAESI